MERLFTKNHLEVCIGDSLKFKESIPDRLSFYLDMASENDDPGLRHLLRITPMPGPVQITLEREPDYFNAARCEGGRHYTFCSHDTLTGEVIGMGCRTVRELYVNGNSKKVGYLSQLRIAPGYRHLGRSMMRQGFELLNETRANDEESFDITTIVAGNQNARRILEYGLPYLPKYTEVDRIITFILPSRGRRDSRGLIALKDKMPGNQVLTPMQFAPVNELPGPLWDQRDFKQIVIRGYSRFLRRFRWIFRLPPIGTVLPAVYLTHNTCNLGELDEMLRRAHSIGGRYLIFSLSVQNPLTDVIRRYYRPQMYESTLYVVHHPDIPVQLDNRLINVEASLL